MLAQQHVTLESYFESMNSEHPDPDNCANGGRDCAFCGNLADNRAIGFYMMTINELLLHGKLVKIAESQASRMGRA